LIDCPLQRVAESNYLACGENFPSLTYVHTYAISDLLAQPFATKTDELVNSVIISLSLVKKGPIGSALSVSSAKYHSSLAYVFGDFQQVNGDGT
jgi:hypothetical protein